MSDLFEQVVAAVTGAWPTDSDRMRDWHPDDQALWRTHPHLDLTARRELVKAQRIRRVAEAVARQVTTAPAAETITVPRELLDQLAPAEPISQDELGGCVWCGMGPGPTGYEQATADPSSHTSDCPWLAARRLLDSRIKNGDR